MKKIKIRPQAIYYPLFTMGLILLGFALQKLWAWDHCYGALIPMSPQGLLGIFTGVFLHANLEHLAGNGLALVVLMGFYFQFYPHMGLKRLVQAIAFLGLMVWLLPIAKYILGYQNHYTCIIGASGLVYFLAFFVGVSGLLKKNLKLMSVSALVILYYGSMVWGVLPEDWLNPAKADSRTSWESHAMGALLGLIYAFVYRYKGEEKRRKFIWEYPNYYSEKDDVLWQTYSQSYPEHFVQLPQVKPKNAWDSLDELPKE